MAQNAKGCITNTGRTWFKKGNIPWNNGTRKKYFCIDCSKQISEKDSKRCHSCAAYKRGPLTEETKKLISLHNKAPKGKNHYEWKGNRVSYRNLHRWVQRWLGKIKECVFCGNEKDIEWASISHHAKRDLNDYVPLCVTCHRRYDKKGRM